jgi:type 1 glutamine amidotransferase
LECAYLEACCSEQTRARQDEEATVTSFPDERPSAAQAAARATPDSGRAAAGDRRGHAVILSGSGRFADPWHPFAETSGRIAAILAGIGFSTEIAGADERMADLSGADLVVVNIGAPSTPDLDRDAANRRGLLRYVADGGPLLVMHVSSTSLPSVPEWESIVGGIWVRGTTMHPDYGRARVHVYPERDRIVSGIGDFELFDERYSYLRVDPSLTPLATHVHDGIEHPLLWAHIYSKPSPADDPGSARNASGGERVPGADTGTASEPARVVYDALGHDARSFDSAEHREIVARAAEWLTAPGTQG